MASGHNTDYTIVVDDEEIKVHRILLEARSPFFKGMLESNMTEAQEGKLVIRDMIAPVVKAVLHFIYTGRSRSLWLSTYFCRYTDRCVDC